MHGVAMVEHAAGHTTFDRWKEGTLVSSVNHDASNKLHTLIIQSKLTRNKTASTILKRHCNSNRYPRNYSTLIEAEIACIRKYPHCGGIFDFYCTCPLLQLFCLRWRSHLPSIFLLVINSHHLCA
jgi:hypothetical protein